MTDKPDNPPAFPFQRPADENSYILPEPHPGMSLRDYFAAAALTGLLTQGYDKFDLGEWSTQAFQYADAMLKARNND